MGGGIPRVVKPPFATSIRSSSPGMEIEDEPATLLPPLAAFSAESVSVSGGEWDVLYGLATHINARMDGVWFAGGCCRRAYLGYPVDEADIDVFCEREALIIVKERLTSACQSAGSGVKLVMAHNSAAGEWGCTYSVALPGKTKPLQVQLLQFRTPSTPASLFYSFDLTCVQAAYSPFGKRLYHSSLFKPDNDARTLRFVRVRSVSSVLKRMEKYVGLGYCMEDSHREQLAPRVANAPPGIGDEDYF